MEPLPIPGTYLIRDLHTQNSGLYDIQWCPPYEGGDSDLELFLEAHSERSDDTGWRADIEEDYPDHIPGSTFGEPEKILAECWVPKNGINDDLDHLCGQWFLTKYQGYPLVLSRWRRLVPGDDFYLRREYPIREAWEEEKKRYQEGKSKPFNIEWYHGLLIKKDKIKAQRAGLRRFRRTLEFIQGVLEAEQFDANENFTRRLTGALYFSVAIAAAPSNPSPAKASDLICHTNNAADCYPKIFEPTKDFQVIHDDQDIPPGLHVRMDIYTGKKEARLNIPMEGEEAKEDIPIEQAMVIVDQPESVKAEPEEKPVQNEPVALRDRQSKKPPAYDNAGKVMPPRPDGEGTVADSSAFQDAVATLTKGDLLGRADVLPTLLDLSHDIYYGAELMKNADVLQQLLWLMYETDWRDAEGTAVTHKRAAGIVANCIQNNPTALKEAQNSWHHLMPGPRKTSTKELSENAKWQSDSAMVERMLLLLREETDPAAMKAKIYALTGLMKNADIKDRFLEQEGLGELLSIFRSEFQNKEWDGVRAKLTEFVSDNFLDEDMGAELGKWPTARSASDKTCARETKNGKPSDDKCWDYWVSVLRSECAEKNDEACEEWTSAFLRLMNNAYLSTVGEAMNDKSEQRQIHFIKDNKKIEGHDRTRDL